MMVEELYDALIEAGASQEKARAASRALANYHDRFERIERKLIEMDERINGRFTHIDGKFTQIDERFNGKFTLLHWMLGFNLAISVAILFRIFS